MLIGVVSCFNEIQFIERCLRSLKSKVGMLVVVDGAYSKFPHKKPWSTDGTIEVARRFCDKLITTNRAYPNQIKKRNKYLIGGNNDWYLMLDGDEELVGRVDGYAAQDDWEIKIYRTDGLGGYPVYRMFRHRPGLKYIGAHNCLVVGNEILNHRKMEILKDCNLIHFTGERARERNADKTVYYNSRTEEAEFRKKYLI